MESIDDRSVRLTIEAQPSDAAMMVPATSTPFEPQSSADMTTPRPIVIARQDGAEDAVPVAAAGPERRLTLLALRLAVLEKAASGLGALGFIWATVVLLGGFAITLGRVDFWSVTAILLVEGGRVFSRSHELEWQHHATWSLSLAAAGRSSARLVARSFRRIVFRRHVSAKPPTSASAVCRKKMGWPWSGWSWSHLSGHVGRLFYWLQLASATSCVALSAARLARQDFGDALEARTNRRSALDIFYALALVEALLFLAERAAWEWEVGHGRLLERVARECRLGGAQGILAVRRFFYDAYSRSIEGSVFDGLRMDLVSFASELLVGGSRDEQRIGVGILVNVDDDDDALRRVGASPALVERLVDMLSWKGADESDARASAAIVVSKLASKKRNALRVASVPGAIEAVASLLYTDDEECNLLGLLIVKKLARDHHNCSRIGGNRGLLDKIIQLVSAISSSGPTVVSLTPSRAKAVQRALQVLKMLCDTTGETGTRLRREVAGVVFTFSNIRAVLRLSKDQELRRLVAEVLTRLAMDADARERIGETGGVVTLLLDMFLLLRPTTGPNGDEHDAAARKEAGEALAMLALESPRNCDRILKSSGCGAHTATVDRLVDALDDQVIGVGAARVLTHLCAYAGSSSSAWFPRLRVATRGAATVLRRVASTVHDECRQMEASLGLAAQLVRLMDGPHELAHHLVNAGVKESDLVNGLVAVLASYPCGPSIQAPRIRRFAVDLVIALLRLKKRTFAELMRNAGLGAELRRVAETTSEIECFHVFSGSAGVGRHAVGLAELVDAALELMGDDDVAADQPHV
ncbi:hypothetical protein QOZ80_5BG0440780 [Eleusine coracana subsp. coracana]|nr:hypothetical protein QOZ80_5BG0440780 [Eleusine coracana subsp. coracana]